MARALRVIAIAGCNLLAALSFSAVVAEAQPVLLQIRPHVGDTLSVRMDQQMEITGVPVDCDSLSSLRRNNARQRSASCANSEKRMSSMTEVFSRAIVTQASRDGALVLAVTDSVRTSASGGGKKTSPARVNRRDKAIQLRMSTDGGAEVVDADASDDMRAVFGQMPATLSRQPVSVGDKWTREMRMPVAGESRTSGLVKATFQLDSLSDGGNMAYISMRGTLSHEHEDGSNSEMSGWMTGSMKLDRSLAWITETRAVIDVTTVVKAPAGGLPMRVRTRITQYLKAGKIR